MRIIIRSMLGVGLAVAVFLSACAPKSEAPPSSPGEAIDAPTTEAVSEPVEAETEEPTQEEAAAETEAATKPVVRSELEATDPTTVLLASGKPTLLEFFAFW
jgi:hypothetical protein